MLTMFAIGFLFGIITGFSIGVLLYKKCVKTDEFFKRWSHEFRKSGLNVDQTTFRETLWDSDIKFHVLPEQLNKRLIDPCELIYTDKPSPFIVHLPVLRPAKNLFQKFKSALSRRYYLSKGKLWRNRYV